MIIPTISLKYQLPDSNTISETADYIPKMLAGQVAYIHCGARPHPGFFAFWIFHLNLDCLFSLKSPE